MLNNHAIVLYAPEIPGNTGSIGRTCVALGLRLILIKPYGFSIDEKSLRRAGLDYWKHVNLTEYENFEEFLIQEKPHLEELCFFSKLGKNLYREANVFSERTFLIFGSETRGLPESILKEYSERLYSLPMFSEHIRSLNLANVATTVSYELLRQLTVSESYAPKSSRSVIK
jgi:tRNA (cytidine/uridine-2'-O-)-methyltransferase